MALNIDLNSSSESLSSEIQILDSPLIRYLALHRGTQHRHNGDGRLRALWTRVSSTVMFLNFQAIIFSSGLLNYHIRDDYSYVLTQLGWGFSIGRAAALVLDINALLLFLTVCFQSITGLIGRYALYDEWKVEAVSSLHAKIGWTVVFFSLVHVFSFMISMSWQVHTVELRAQDSFRYILESGPGWTGSAMLIVVIAIAVASRPRFRDRSTRASVCVQFFHILLFLLWGAHGSFCMFPSEEDMYCERINVFSMVWFGGGLVFVIELLLREVQSSDAHKIIRVVQHCHETMEIRMQKGCLEPKAGQYIIICCPATSVTQYISSTFTSAPEEDYLSLHIRCETKFTKQFAQLLGCNFGADGMEGTKFLENVGTGVDSPLMNQETVVRRMIPSIQLYGPFGSTAEEAFKYEVAILIGVGKEVIPFASIMKSAWYRIRYPRQQCRFKKLYFFWICKDFGNLQWLQSLCMAVEDDNPNRQIEIHTYLTGRANSTELRPSLGAHMSMGLRNPTAFGLPNWDAVFCGIKTTHTTSELPVFFSGPSQMSIALQSLCSVHSDSHSSFVWKGNQF